MGSRDGGKHLQSMRKIAVLDSLKTRSWTRPSEIAHFVFPSGRAAYVYLKKMHRQGLLHRSDANGFVRYRISPRGMERLNFLVRLSGKAAHDAVDHRIGTGSTIFGEAEAGSAGKQPAEE
jgi:hypothetical protein